MGADKVSMAGRMELQMQRRPELAQRQSVRHPPDERNCVRCRGRAGSRGLSQPSFTAAPPAVFALQAVSHQVFGGVLLEFGRFSRECASRGPIHRKDLVLGRCSNMVLVALPRATIGRKFAAGEFVLATAPGSVLKQIVSSVGMIDEDLFPIRHGSYLHLASTMT